MKNFINVLFSLIGGYVGFFFGGLDGLLTAIIVFIIVDYITGVIRAIIEQRLSSAIGFKGLLKKVVILIVISLGHMMDCFLLGDGDMVRNACIFFYISNEGISILENVVALGVPVPDILRNVLEQLNKEDNDHGDKDTD